MTDYKLQKLASNLKDIESLRLLLSELNFDYEDKPVNNSNWTKDQKEAARCGRIMAKIVAKKYDYRIFYIRTETNTPKEWKGIASKIIQKELGQCIVCSHNPEGFKWVFSSLSKEFSKTFSETRHISIDINPQSKTPKPFVEFLEKIRVTENSSTASIMSQVSSAFDYFAIQIHDELTVNVFEALRVLSEGILADKSNKLVLDEQTLEDIREPVFILLYRIMFVLYAEDRGVFPDTSIYHDKFSLKWIKSEWILKPPTDIKEHQVYKRLKDLFRLIEVGSDGLDYDPDEFCMPSYYGRLFDKKIHYRLDKWKIPNKSVLEAIGLLTRTSDKQGNWFFLDYAALDTRHLGAIYEHLLEYHLAVREGQIADLPNPKERKATGSYYTPKYIVDYIVKSTVGPLIDNIVQKTTPDSDPIDQILNLNILDPAMGSGHFLVGVVNYIARRICEIEGEVSEDVFNKRKRDVARRCVYGVDLNPLATDLAAVSLWLETLSSEKPLSFLSAHLKSGNSLIGSTIDDILEKQTTLTESEMGRTEFKNMVRDFIMLETLKDDTAAAVKTKIETYANIKQGTGTVYHDLKLLLDAKTAELFGVDTPPLADYASKIGQNSPDFHAEGDSWRKVAKAAAEHSFFHWDLEFPDIFYGPDGRRKENPGFDAVVGNPPYVRQEMITHKKAMQISSFDMDDFQIPSKTDLSGYFYYRSLNVLKADGRLGFITSDSWMNSGYGKLLQRALLKTKIAFIMKTRFNIFQADTKTVTLVLDKSTAKHHHNVNVVYVNCKEEFDSEIKSTYKKPQKDLVEGNWNLYFTSSNLNHKTPMTLMSETGIVKRGIVTGHKKFFVLSSRDVTKYQISEKYRCPIVTNLISAKQLQDNHASEWMLDVNEPTCVLAKTTLGKHILKYIEIGEDTDVVITRGKTRTTVKLPQLATTKSRKLWYSLNLGEPPAIFLSRLINNKVKVYKNNGNFHAINTFVYFTPTNLSHTNAFLAYFSSSLFSLYLERNGRPMGGGALSVETIDYKKSLVPDFKQMSKNNIQKISKAWNEYCSDSDLSKLDQTVLQILKFQPHEVQQIHDQVNILRSQRLKRRPEH